MSSHYDDYKRLYAVLSNTTDDLAADHLRDRMDALWYSLTPEEIERFNNELKEDASKEE